MAEPNNDKSITIGFTFPKATIKDMRKGFDQKHTPELNSNGDPKFPGDAWIAEKMRRIIIADIYEGLGLPAPDPVDYDSIIEIRDIVVF